MLKCEAILTAKLLDMAAERFSNHGCNDLPDALCKQLSNDEWRSLAVKVKAMGAPSEYEDVDDASWALRNDWMLMRAMADIIRHEHGIKD